MSVQRAYTQYVYAKLPSACVRVCVYACMRVCLRVTINMILTINGRGAKQETR